MDRPSPKVLIVDSYDSFTHNLAALVADAVPSSEILIIRNDELSTSEVKRLLPYFSAVVVGPGPGSPEVPEDIGIVRELWHLPDDLVLPIFGVCLGLQSLGVEFGATLKRLNVVKHGQNSIIEYVNDELYKGVSRANVVRYHSLCIELGTAAAKQLRELAWADDGVENGRVVMAIKHTSKPFWAVQYHPESARTDDSGPAIMRNFWDLASRWAATAGRSPKDWDVNASSILGPQRRWPYPSISPNVRPRRGTLQVQTKVVDPLRMSTVQICESLGVYKNESDFVFLDSATKAGRYSIIGCLSRDSLRVTYYEQDRSITIRKGKQVVRKTLDVSGVWEWLSMVMDSKRATGGCDAIPFWGGLLGYLSYEFGIGYLKCKTKPSNGSKRNPDVNLVFVERSIVIDTKKNIAYVQSILPNDHDWISATTSLLTRVTCTTANDYQVTTTRNYATTPPEIEMPDEEEYKHKIRVAKNHLFAGESYELCVTAPTIVRVPKLFPHTSHSSSWYRYKTVRERNPAPFAAYLRLHPTTLISSSPERFLSFSRPPEQICQLRPIKGTVSKASGATWADAEKILSSPKEVAENLMIVDLIRHDLYGSIGKDVAVKKFCGIEEYETVWQLVSVIEGNAAPAARKGASLGWDILQRSLPPGSMTGAPKKRSVEILQDIEGDKRGVYSGVMGYYCVGGSGDWSVIIRSCFMHDDISKPDTDENVTEEWQIGAGGAITALSDPQDEWEEMLVKLQSVLTAFR